MAMHHKLYPSRFGRGFEGLSHIYLDYVLWGTNLAIVRAFRIILHIFERNEVDQYLHCAPSELNGLSHGTVTNYAHMRGK